MGGGKKRHVALGLPSRFTTIIYICNQKLFHALSWVPHLRRIHQHHPFMWGDGGDGGDGGEGAEREVDRRKQTRDRSRGECGGE